MGHRTTRAARGIRLLGSGGIEELDRRRRGRDGLELDPASRGDAGHDGEDDGVGPWSEKLLDTAEQLLTVGLVRDVGTDLRDVALAEAT